MRLRSALAPLGLLVMVAAVSPPGHDLAERSLAWHMTQHAALSVIGPPLLLLGAPYELLPAGLRRRLLRALRRAKPLLRRPEPPTVLFSAVVVAVHLPGGVRLAESSAVAHAAEHGLLVAVALAFWTAVLATGPWPAASAPRRFACVLAAMPAGDAVGVWLMATGGAGYEGVSGSEARAAGAVMLAGSVVLAAAAAAVAWQAVTAEERRRRRREVLHAAP
jgi:cytochrome c oxidase assembly factor CtaG